MVDWVVMSLGVLLVFLNGVVAAAMFGMALLLARRRARFMKESVRVKGKVVKLSKVRAGRSIKRTIYRPVVEFTDEKGTTHQVESRIGGAKWDDMIGKPLGVRYLPGRPEKALVGSDTLLGPKAFIILGCVLAAFEGLLLIVEMR